MNRTQRVSLWLRAHADSRRGHAALFIWAFAEALVWPIIPDASLAVLVVGRPRRWLSLAAAAVAGSVAGGATGLLAAARGLTWPLPLTTPRMTEAVEGWLEVGASGLAHQPLSGVPYKVFVAGAPEAGISVWAFIAGTVQYRAPRLIAVAAVTALVGAIGWRFVPSAWHSRVHVRIIAAGTLGLLAGLAAVVGRWS